MPTRQERLNAAATFRMSRADRDRMAADARAEGLSIQQLFELRMFGEIRPRYHAGRPRKPRNQEELPIAQSA